MLGKFLNLGTSFSLLVALGGKEYLPCQGFMWITCVNIYKEVSTMELTECYYLLMITIIIRVYAFVPSESGQWDLGPQSPPPRPSLPTK